MFVYNEMDDWENIDENEIVISLSEKKKLEERKMQEDADHDLTNELFSNNNKNNTFKQTINPVKVVVVETNKPSKPPRQIHTNKPQPKKEKRITKDDVFGSCELDKYEDEYCEMEDNILNK
jgi:hypothetical protein